MTLRLLLTDGNGIQGLTATFGAIMQTNVVATAADAAAAAASATSAANSATSATASAGSASTSASSAATSASGAASSASAASGSASAAATSATNAGNSATAAAGSAGAASTSASNAATSATNAGNSATAAATSASNAAATLANALTKANNLSDVANAATAAHNLGLGTADTPTFTGEKLIAASPALTMQDTGQSGGAGLFRWRDSGGILLLERNTAAAGDFSTKTTPWQLNGSDIITFLQSPQVPTLSPGDTSQGAANAAFVAAAMAPFSGRNRIINGACMIAQRSSVSVTSAGQYGGPDRFVATNTAGGAFTQSQSTMTFGGKTHNCVVQQVTSVMTNNSGVNYWSGIEQIIEGFNVYDLSGSPIALSFLFSASQPGIYSVAIRDSAAAYSYVTTINVAAANTPQRYTVLVPAIPTAASLPRSSAIGLNITVGASNSGTYQTSTLNAWQNANYVTANGYVNWCTTLNATVALTLLQLEAGTVATPFEWRHWGQEILLCQRYFETGTARGYVYQQGGVVAAITVPYTAKRLGTPVAAVGIVSQTNCSGLTAYNVYNTNMMVGSTATSSGTADFVFNYQVSAEF